ncbi:DsbA family protein [Serratia marcescens]|uniref:DsbA family protein n=1 Tax=Serratia marcescens TaxID=615 RepID=UPI003982DB8A
MKKKLLVVTIPLLFSLHTAIAANPNPDTFTPAQQSAIGQIAAEYLRAHPELLIEMSEKLQHQEEQRTQKSAIEAVLANQSNLLKDPASPVVHPEGDVALVQFFDYQCIWCSRMAPVVESLIEGDKTLRVVFKEWPIFGKQWPLSTFAARTGLSVWKAGAADGYLKYHDALYQTGHVEGQLTRDDITRAVTAAGFKESQLTPATVEALSPTAELANKLGINGTPAFIVMPVKDATVDNTSVIFGAVDITTLQAAIAKARATGGHP